MFPIDRIARAALKTGMLFGYLASNSRVEDVIAVLNNKFLSPHTATVLEKVIVSESLLPHVTDEINK
jgi:hypothetical protein